MRLLALLLATAATLLAWSEFIFLNEGPTLALVSGDFEVALLHMGGFYLIPAAALLALARLRWPARWWHVLIAGCLVGWVIEGAMVPAVYEAPPISYVWTSLAWHAPVDVWLGLFVFAGLLWAKTSAVWMPIAVTAAGVTWGLWATWPWDSGTQLTLDEFILLAGISTILAITGPLAWAAWGDRVMRLPVWAAWGVLALNLALFLIVGSPYMIWLVGLVACMALVLWLWWRQTPSAPMQSDLRPARAAWFALMPVLAVAVYATLLGLGRSIPSEDMSFLAFTLGSLIVFAALVRGFIAR